MVRLSEVQEAAGLLSGIAQRTPVLTSSSLSSRSSGTVLIKAEHLQRTGSFKIRGAYVRLCKLDDDQRKRGVVAASAGNHAQGVAWAASALGIRSTVVMPVFAPLQKVEATRRYGAQVELSGDTFEDSLRRAREIASECGSVLVHAFDDPWIMSGQGTVGLEICQDVKEADRVVVPLGGGGLISGVATAVKALCPSTKIIGVRPSSAPATIADGVAVKRPGDQTQPVIDALVDDIVSVDEDEISAAILFALERMKQVLEGAGALAVAGVLAGAVPTTGTSVLIASGGNIDPGLLMRVIRHGLSQAGRYLFVRLELTDRPGELQSVLTLLADKLVNVLSVVHHRAGASLAVGAVDVELLLETRNRDHATEVVRALGQAGYSVRL